jgi:hypothetical protein
MRHIFIGGTAYTAYVKSNTYAETCDGVGSRLVRGKMSFDLLHGPTKLRKNLLPHEPTTSIDDYTFSLVFWVEDPERSL